MKILIQTDDKCTNCNGTGYIAPGMPCSYCERTGFHRKWVDVKLNEIDKEIERLIEVNKACHALIKARGKEIEQLKRELSEAYLTISSNKGNEQ